MSTMVQCNYTCTKYIYYDFRSNYKMECLPLQIILLQF